MEIREGLVPLGGATGLHYSNTHRMIVVSNLIFLSVLEKTLGN